MNKTDKKWVLKKPLMVSCIITLIIFVCCTGKFSSSTQSLRSFLLKAVPKIVQTFTGKRPCWSPILVKLQNCITGVFQWIFRKISELLFYRTTANCYFGTKRGRCKYWSSNVLLESGITSEKAKFRFFRKKERCKFCHY